MDSSTLMRQARLDAGLTQTELARRLGVTQPTIAALERPGSNPRVRTLERALEATGHHLYLYAPTWGADVDGSLVREHRRRSPGERLRSLADMRRLTQKARRAG